ncbi:NlpC/P60 family [[Clostridium] sordellii]|uniref:transglycosylase SLT domain-containing protein n=1 Tax=Paraclostridium sordellii TaxID=1505 RepID=UPI0005DD4852|nr:transglycosylase SLT domain-containing protein [Paeniclostridium sordellii]CEQ26487.1 NlpC/P60 family [[Clostridium] sordellii] [Paeniclostridium sordellii]
MFSNGDKYIISKIEFDDDNPTDLCWSAYKKLQEMKQTKFEYEVPAYLKDEDYDNLNTGDTVHIINDKFNPPIQLKARIAELILKDNENECKFLNYKEVKSNIKKWNKNDIIKDTIDKLIGFEGKLTQADIDRIREFLADLDIQSEEIEKLLKKYEDILEDTVIDKTEIAEDSEDYRAIKLSKIDGGLWIGDNRIYSIKKNKCATIVSSGKGRAATSSASATEYKNAVDYYSKFSLGTSANTSYMDKLISSSNKYKVSTIVKYWCKKFGLDPYLVYAVIMAESSGNPYCKTKSSAGGYGIMQCERAAYFNKKQTIKFIDGSTKSFTPSYSTMNPDKGSTGSINGVAINRNINNQIMFGCHELRKSLERFHYNIFASLVGYNFGLGGADWCVCRYVANKNNLSFVDSTLLSKQSSKVKDLYYKELDTLKCAWGNQRKIYVSQKRAGTATNIEGYLKYYRVVDGQLPYTLDSKGNKKGYGVNKTSSSTSNSNTTIKTGVATTIRNKIVAKAKEICTLHQKYKKATYSQKYRISDDSKRYQYKGTLNGIKNPYCYDCSSLASCSYLCTGLNSVYNKSCQAGTLISSATSKPGYKLWKLTKTSANNLIAGDLIMMANYEVPSNITAAKAKTSGYTHHVMVYAGKDSKGNHMIAHASKPASPPNAIRYETIDAYISGWSKSNVWKYGIGLRPWDIAKKDSEATMTITKPSTEAPKVEANEVNLKGLNGSTPGDYYDDKTLIEDITINNITDDDKYPKTVSHCFLHFGINDLSDEGIQNYKNLINVLLKKYPKKPIFIAKEFYVDSRYGTNWEEKNTEITNFNNAMLDYCNKTKYVIQVGVPAAILDSNKKYLSTTYSTDGWTMKDKTACNAYYTAYKKAILVLSTGGSVSSSSTSANLSLHTENIYKYTKPMKSIEFRLPTKPNDSYYSRLIFTTGSNTKYIQSELVHLMGTDTSKGQLIIKDNTTYDIKIYYNPDTEISTKKYLGSVTAYRKGTVAGTQYTFKYASNLVSYAKTFLTNKSKFVYNNTTPLDYSEPLTNIANWKDSNGKMHIDDSAFLNYILMGFDYKTSHYGNQTTRNHRKKNEKVNWAQSYVGHEANIAKYFVEKGWIVHQADITNYTNLKAGDILFMDSDSVNNNEFMGISHTAIYVGNKEVIECTNNSNVVQQVNVSTLSSKNVLLVGRIKIT